MIGHESPDEEEGEEHQEEKSGFYEEMLFFDLGKKGVYQPAIEIVDHDESDGEERGSDHGETVNAATVVESDDGEDHHEVEKDDKNSPENFHGLAGLIAVRWRVFRSQQGPVFIGLMGPGHDLPDMLHDVGVLGGDIGSFVRVFFQIIYFYGRVGDGIYT